MAIMWRLSLSYLRKNKTQNGFSTLLILLSTLLVATAVIILANTGNLFKEMHDRAHGSHQILSFEKDLNDPQAVYDWWQEQEHVDVSPLLQYRTLSGITFDGLDIPNLYLYMIDTPAPPWDVDKLIFASGLQPTLPEQGSVWIPTSMANSYHIAIGDTISFRAGSTNLNLTVSDIVVDVPYGAPFTNTARVWMNPTDYQQDVQALAGNDNYMFGIHFDDYSTNSRYWEKYNLEHDVPFLETKMEFESISSFYLIINQIIGFIMIFLGVVMLVIALVTIGFTISDAILANYKTIGILKSLGLTSHKMIGTYVIQYAILSLVAILPGLMLSVWISKPLMSISVSSLRAGGDDIPMQGIGAALLVSAFLFALVLLFVMLYANKARHIEPVQAIRYGMSEADHIRIAQRMNTPFFRAIGFSRYPVSVVIGFRNLMKNIRSSALILLLTMMASAVLVLGYVVVTSVSGIYQTAANWGYDNANIAAVVVNKSHFSLDKLEQVLEQDNRIQNVGWQGNTSGVIRPDTSINTQSQSTSLFLSVLDGSYDQLGFENLRGSNPRLENQISIGVNIAKTYHKDLGDLIDIYIEGQKRTFVITGVYQAIANMSVSGRITMDAMHSVNSSYKDVDVVFINVNDPVQVEPIVHALNEQFKDSTSVVTQKTLLDSVYAEAADILVYPMTLIGLLFILVTFIIIFSTCRISIRKESRTYGIYKSIGLTSSQIRLSIAMGIVILSSIGALLGIVIGIYVLPVLLELVLSGYGIVELPLILNWAGILLFACLTILAAAYGSWVSSRVIRHSSPRNLVIE
ncbi:putative ABC transport system permease protein [Paenibacillus amylolyticus]|uniref:ABC transport system permease protein n=1 Tax=Paenibacillus amylolyticus TaxID=1451 RepID=A0AAP5LQT6_PAEAM|nr:FtsX-like permease family protein [Paenibacillus amylolyticus]MDR6725883.1 putative ABC transport system permease protein [Paenibacillus amylolyticus]